MVNQLNFLNGGFSYRYLTKLSPSGLDAPVLARAQCGSSLRLSVDICRELLGAGIETLEKVWEP
jgi:hypothetical protein